MSEPRLAAIIPKLVDFQPLNRGRSYKGYVTVKVKSHQLPLHVLRCTIKHTEITSDPDNETSSNPEHFMVDYMEISHLFFTILQLSEKISAISRSNNFHSISRMIRLRIFSTKSRKGSDSWSKTTNRPRYYLREFNSRATLGASDDRRRNI